MTILFKSNVQSSQIQSRLLTLPSNKIRYLWANLANRRSGLVALLTLTLTLPLLTQAADAPLAPAKPALSVSVIKPEQQFLNNTLTANGSVFAWQEASVSAQVSGLRLLEINAAVGDAVKKGQILARFDTETLNAETAAVKAQVAEAQAASDEAHANANRARELAQKGFYSTQAVSQVGAQEKAAQARLEAAQANLKLRQLRVNDSVLRAPDAGIITARNAAIGSVVNAGVELFRMNRLGRLEWRAEVTSAELGQVVKGSKVSIETGTGATIMGTVRQIAPNLDPQTRNALVYVDIAANPNGILKIGQFVRGQFMGNPKPAMTVPINSVVMRDGFAYVFVLKPNTNKVSQLKLVLGQRQDKVVEVLSGLTQQATVIATGAAFLADGDTVKVVQP